MANGRLTDVSVISKVPFERQNYTFWCEKNKNKNRLTEVFLVKKHFKLLLYYFLTYFQRVEWFESTYIFETTFSSSAEQNDRRTLPVYMYHADRYVLLYQGTRWVVSRYREGVRVATVEGALPLPKTKPYYRLRTNQTDSRTGRVRACRQYGGHFIKYATPPTHNHPARSPYTTPTPLICRRVVTVRGQLNMFTKLVKKFELLQI